MDPRTIKIEDYTYTLPEERIAKYPLQERDASKLLIYKDGTITESIYKNIAAQLPQGSLLVFNQTRVVHARLLFKKPTGGIIEIFCLEPGDVYADIQTAMLQKGRVLWKCLIGGASKWKHGMVLQLHPPGGSFVVSAAIAERQSDSYVIELSWNDASLTFAEVLHHVGKIPLPPYLHRDAEASDEDRYQTIFAKEEGSVAAPTAGLHFTPAVMQSIADKGIDTGFITLHVGAGTFKPVKSETLQEHEMHAEWIEITPAILQQLATHYEKGIIPVGTTSLRTLESLYWIGVKLIMQRPVDFAGIAVNQWEPYELDNTLPAQDAIAAVQQYMQQQNLQRLITRTQIIITPGYDIKMARALVTNFHQPQSTLLLLVSAMIGDAWRDVYQYALNHDYRFLSYGDGCLLWKV